MDTGDSAAAAALWAEDGVLESDLARLVGPDAVAAMVESDGQQSLIRDGCAHVQAFPLVTVDGDSAVATGYSRVYRFKDGAHEDLADLGEPLGVPADLRGLADHQTA